MKTTVYTIINVYAANVFEARAAKQYIERNTADVHFSDMVYKTCDEATTFRVAMWPNDNNPINFKSIALSLQNQGFGVEFYAG